MRHVYQQLESNPVLLSGDAKGHKFRLGCCDEKDIFLFFTLRSLYSRDCEKPGSAVSNLSTALAAVIVSYFFFFWFLNNQMNLPLFVVFFFEMLLLKRRKISLTNIKKQMPALKKYSFALNLSRLFSSDF